jgi:hypothetical protein
MDTFALWVSGRESGRESGVYAFGVVTEPTELQPEDPDPYWQGSTDDNGQEWLVGIKIERVLKRPVLNNVRGSRLKIMAKAHLSRRAYGSQVSGAVCFDFPSDDVEIETLRV